MKPIPIWMQPRELENWPTKIISSQKLHYQLSIYQNWLSQPKVIKTPLEVKHFYEGHHKGEGLVIKFMDQAEAESNICNWVEAFLRLTGFPILVIQKQFNTPPKLLKWQDEGTCPELTKKLNVDEIHLYQGLAQISEPYPSLIRIYTFLARRKKLAWQINLSLSSACLPDTPEERVEVNDHFRSGAIFGNLQLL